MWYPISEFRDLAGCIQMTQDNGVDLFKQPYNFSIMDWFLQHGAHYPNSAPMVVLLKCFPLSQFPSSWIITNHTADNSFSGHWFDLGIDSAEIKPTLQQTHSQLLDRNYSFHLLKIYMSEFVEILLTATKS